MRWVFPQIHPFGSVGVRFIRLLYSVSLMGLSKGRFVPYLLRLYVRNVSSFLVVLRLLVALLITY